ncbi:MAG: lipoxygenase family protein [Thiolinea sp.]
MSSEQNPSTDNNAIPEPVYKKCQAEGSPHYNDLGFFTPHLRNINHLAIGRSRIISSPVTILLELGYQLYMRVRDTLKNFWQRLCPKDLNAPCVSGKADSQLVGSLVFAGQRDVNKPIHNMHVVFWARTWAFQWRKLSEGVSGKDGSFNLPFHLRAARNWWIMSRKFEIYQTHYRYNPNGERHFDYTLFKSISIRGDDLIGMQYNLHPIQLFYWEYRTDSSVPRVIIKNHDKDAPQSYSQGRSDALNQQFIPIELTKLSHLEKLKENPDSLTIQAIQNDYPVNLTVCMERNVPDITRGDAWFGVRIMNGMYAATFIADQKHAGHYQTQIFGTCQYDHNNEYAFPSAKIRFSLTADGEMMPEEIQLTGPLTATDNDPHTTQRFTPADGEKWLQAKRVARVSGALSAELDDHFAGTHLVTEQYAIAAYRNLRLSPVAALLFPHLKEVVLVNHSADSILVGPAQPAPQPSSIRDGGLILWLEDRISRWLNKAVFETGGYIPQASALTAKGISQRVHDLMGVQDWKDWQPMSPINANHYFAHAQNAYWEMLGEYVDEYIDDNLEAIKKHWLEIYRFSEDLVQHAVPVFLSDKDLDNLEEQDRKVAEERLHWYSHRYSFNPGTERVKIDGELKVISPLTLSEHFQPEDLNNLKALCRYCIMISTFMHSFVNEHQYDDIGEVLYNSLGLRFGDGENGVMAPESDTRIAPSLERSTQMMWFSNLLSRTEYGFIVRNEEGDINPKLIAALKSYQNKIEQDGKGILIKNIESRTNI